MVTVKIGMDQWVVCRTNSTTNLYTAGLSGCVAVVLFSQTHIGLTHVASSAGKAWPAYEHELELMWIVCNIEAPVTRALLMAVGRFDHPPFKNLNTWLYGKGLDPEEMEGNGIFVEPNGVIRKHEALSFDTKNRGYVRLFEPAAWAAITNQGKLSGEAAMPSKAIGGATENEDDDD